MTTEGKGMRGRVAIVLPPGGQFAYPTLAPASLKGYLRSAGVMVDLVDLNIMGFYDVASPANVARLFTALTDIADARRAELADRPDRRDLLDFLCGLPPAERSLLTDIPERVRQLDCFRQETTYWRALYHLGLLTALVEFVFDPVQFLPGSLIGGMFARLPDLCALRNTPTPYDESVFRHLVSRDWTSYDAIGISAFTFDQLVYSLRIAPRLRELAPHALLVLGGNCLTESEIPTSLKATLADAVDIVVQGDGELPLLRAVEYARGEASLDQIPNAFYTQGERLVHNDAVYKYRFERGTAPDFDGLPMDKYLSPWPVIPFRFSNGCGYGKCTFCSESADRGPLTSRLVYEEIPVDQLVEHLSELRRKWSASIFVNCSSLVSAKGGAEIGDAIVRAGLPIQWFAMVRAERDWTPEVIERSVSGGATALNFGVESFHPRVNRAMRKGINVDRAPEIMKAFRDRGVAVTCYTLANFPGETIAEFDFHLARLSEHFKGAFDIIFRSDFFLVADAPVAEQRVDLVLKQRVDEQLDRLRQKPFPIYLLPDERGAPEFRTPGDGLEEKLDHYHAVMLGLLMHEPLYFERSFEIVSRTFYWEPEYNMIIREVGGKRFLPSYSLAELLRSDVRVAAGVVVRRIDSRCVTVKVPGQAIALYYGPYVGAVLEHLVEGVHFRDAFQWVVANLNPSARELVQLYEQVHRELRQAGALVVNSPPRRLSSIHAAEVPAT